MRTRLAIMIGAAALSTSACAAADGVYGGGYGYADGYGFTCYDNGLYGSGLYGGYGFSNCGWYNGFFYPGFGNFVFDRDHHRHRMTGDQHDYFTRQARGPDGGRRVGLGSSGGVTPPAMSPQQGMPQQGMPGTGFGAGRPGGTGQGGGFRGSGGGRGSPFGGAPGGGRRGR